MPVAVDGSSSPAALPYVPGRKKTACRSLLISDVAEMPCRYALICSTESPGPKILTLGPKSGGAGAAATAGATPEKARAPVTPAAATARSLVRRLVVPGMVVLPRGGRA